MKKAHEESFDMTIPNGLTCGDCTHMARCGHLFGAHFTSKVCDWWPIRFYPRVEVVEDPKEDKCTS